MDRKITICGTDYAIEPWPFKVFQQVFPLFQTIDIDQEGIANRGLIICNAIRTVKPEFTNEEFGEMKVTWPELLAATTTIGMLNGFYKAAADRSPSEDAAPPGEAKAAGG